MILIVSYSGFKNDFEMKISCIFFLVFLEKKNFFYLSRYCIERRKKLKTGVKKLIRVVSLDNYL